MAHRRHRKSPAHPWLAFLVLTLAAGLLTAGMAVPGVALAVGATRIASNSLQYLPQALIEPVQPEKSTVYMADGTVLATFYQQNRTYVPLAQIAPVMQQAQVAIEDRRFYDHGAVDVQGMVRAFLTGFLHGQQQGASSLTQQYVKQVRIQDALDRGDHAAYLAATEASYARKIVEMRYAVALEKELTKDQILEKYLNIVYYGGGAYGIEAAAEHWFSTTAAQLTLAQAAMIAGLAQNPSNTDPVNNPSAALSRRNAVLDAMASPDVGYITQAQADAAKREGFDPTLVQPTYEGCANAPAGFEFLCDYVVKTLTSDKMPGLGNTADERLARLKRAGLEIHTLIDPNAQRTALASVQAYVAPTDPVIAVTATIQPSTGLIIALAQSRPFGNDPTLGQTNWNYAVDHAMGGAEGFQAGSTFKAFTLAAALAQGAPYDTVYPAPNNLPVGGWKMATCSGTQTFPKSDPWKGVNEGGGSYGEINLQRALTQSINTYFLQLERDVGLCNVVRMAQSAGVAAAINGPYGGTDLVSGWRADAMPSFTLGTVEISPLTMASAYGTFANNGIHCDPIILQSVKTKDGQDVEVPSANCQQSIEANVAAGVSQGLSNVISQGSASGNRVTGGYPQAGKTGTTDNRDTEWLVGYTPEISTAAMVAADPKSEFWGCDASGKKCKRTPTLHGVRMPVSGTYFSGTSGTDGGRLWRPVMQAALEGKPATPFPAYKPMKGVFKSTYTPKPKTPTPGASGSGSSSASAGTKPTLAATKKS